MYRGTVHGSKRALSLALKLNFNNKKGARGAFFVSAKLGTINLSFCSQSPSLPVSRMLPGS